MHRMGGVPGPVQLLFWNVGQWCGGVGWWVVPANACAAENQHASTFTFCCTRVTGCVGLFGRRTRSSSCASAGSQGSFGWPLCEHLHTKTDKRWCTQRGEAHETHTIGKHQRSACDRGRSPVAVQQQVQQSCAACACAHIRPGLKQGWTGVRAVGMENSLCRWSLIARHSTWHSTEHSCPQFAGFFHIRFFLFLSTLGGKTPYFSAAPDQPTDLRRETTPRFCERWANALRSIQRILAIPHNRSARYPPAQKNAVTMKLNMLAFMAKGNMCVCVCTA